MPGQGDQEALDRLLPRISYSWAEREDGIFGPESRGNRVKEKIFVNFLTRAQLGNHKTILNI